jgi:hypothetical protein
VNFRANRSVRLFCSASALLVALAGSALAQERPKLVETHVTSDRAGVATAAPSAKQILKKYLTATGGRKAWEKIHSRVSQGNVVVPSMNLIGTAEMFEQAPDRALVKIVLAGSTYLEGFDGKVAWSSDPKDGVHQQSGAQVSETQRESDFRFPLDFRRLYPKISRPTAATIDGRSVYELDGVPVQGGQADRAYFDAETGFLVRIVTQHHNDDGSTEPFEEDFSDYRAVDGIKIPFTLHQRGSHVDFTIQIKNIQQNVPVDDTRFSKPVAQ